MEFFDCSFGSESFPLVSKWFLWLIIFILVLIAIYDYKNWHSWKWDKRLLMIGSLFLPLILFFIYLIVITEQFCG